MNYIINPAWFYFLNLSEKLFIIALITFIASAFCAFVGCIVRESMRKYGENDIDFIIGSVLWKYGFPIAIVSGIIVLFVPTKATVISMMVAKFATYENATWTLDSVKAAVDYIVNAIANIG